MRPDEHRTAEELYRRVDDLFHELVDLPQSERSFRLKQVAAVDESVANMVKEMLNSAADSAFGTSAMPPALSGVVADTPEVREGTVISHYRIGSLIGHGGMGAVYEGYDLDLKRKVAVKFLTTRYSLNGSWRKRFVREAQAAANVSHPNVVTIHEIVMPEDIDSPCIVMERIEGVNLAERMRQRPMNILELLDIAIQIAEGLAAAHEKKVVHCDIKPGNVMLTSSGAVKVTDFGIAKLTLEANGTRTVSTAASVWVAGTPKYMSPEQLSGEVVDNTTSIFSQGVVISEMSAKLPDMSKSWKDLSFRQRRKIGGSLARLDHIARQCQEQVPSQRYQTAGDLATELKTVQAALKRVFSHTAFARRREAVVKVACLALVAIVFAFSWARWGGVATEPPGVGRLLARSTAETGTLQFLPLNHRPEWVAISNDGSRLFSVAGFGQELTIVKTIDNSLRTITLPAAEAGPLAVAPRGDRLYIASLVDGILVLDITKEKLLPGRIATGGAVFDMAFTADGKKLFLAQGKNGMKRYSIDSAQLALVTERRCLENLEIDNDKARLYVAFQCSTPAGHDVVEVYDTTSETRLATIGGPDVSMVGGKPALSPDENVVMLDAWDVCSNSIYDHASCTPFPSHLRYLLDPLNYRIFARLESPAAERTSAAVFLDNSRFLLPGDTVSVFNKNRLTEPLEKLHLSDRDYIGHILFSPDRQHAYLANYDHEPERGVADPLLRLGGNGLLSVDLEDQLCSPLQEGLAMFFPLDGTLVDAAGSSDLVQHGKVQFTRGKVGQSVFLNGSFMSAPWTGHFQPGGHDFSVALYVKFASSRGDAVIIDWTDENPRRGFRLLKTPEDRFVFESWPSGTPLIGSTTVTPGVWYRVTITRDDREITLYLNGEVEHVGAPPVGRYNQLSKPLYFGARSGQPSFHGWLDEIAFYNRALGQDDVRREYQSRASGPCHI